MIYVIYSLLFDYMFMHLGLDRVLICSALGQTIVPFAAIDTVLPQVVIDLYQKSQPDTIYVITGP